MKKILSVLVIFFLVTCCADVFASDDLECTVYAPDGRVIKVAPYDVEAYKAVGWYDYPVAMLYASDGRNIVVAKSEVEAYKNVGWYDYPVALLYASDGRTIVVAKSEVATWEAVGWRESQKIVPIYSQAGECINVTAAEVSIYAQWGWTDNIDDARTIVYSSKGSEYVYNAEVSTYLSLGWSLTPVRIDYVTPLPTTIVSYSGYSSNSIDIEKFDVTKFEYLAQSDKVRIHYDIKAKGGGICISQF